MDELIQIYVDYYNVKAKCPKIKDPKCGPLVAALSKSEKLFKPYEMMPKGGSVNLSSHLIELFGLKNPISNEQHELFICISNNLRSLTDYIFKIKPLLMRGIIHYFFLLGEALNEIESNNLSETTESIFVKYPILDKQYTSPFFKVTLFCLSGFEEEITCIISSFILRFPTCTMVNHSSCFSSPTAVNLDLRLFDSIVFHSLINLTSNIHIFSIILQYYNLLIDNFDYLKEFELNNMLNIHTFLGTPKTQKYLQDIHEDDLFSIADGFSKLICNSTFDRDDDQIIDLKITVIYSIMPLFTVLQDHHENCASHIIKDKHVMRALIAFTTFSFSHAKLLSLVRDDIGNEIDSETTVQAIQNLNNIPGSTECTEKLNLTSWDNTILPVDLPDLPQYLINAIPHFKSYLYNIQNPELFLFLIEEAKDFSNSILTRAPQFNVLNEFKLFDSIDRSTLYYPSFILMDLYIVNELIRHFQEFNSDIISFDRLNFLFNDVIFERPLKVFHSLSENQSIRNDQQLFDNQSDQTPLDNQNQSLVENQNGQDNANQSKELDNNQTVILVNSNSNDGFYVDITQINKSILKRLRQSFFDILSKISKYFMSDVLVSISNFIIDSKLSICDEILGLLFELKNNREKIFFDAFPVSLFETPFVSYSINLHNNSDAMKRFYSFLLLLLKQKEICNQLFERELFCTFFAHALHNKELANINNNLFESFNFLNSTKSIVSVTNFISIPCLRNIEQDQANEKIIANFRLLYYISRNITKVALAETPLVNEIIKVLDTATHSKTFELIFKLIGRLQYSRSNLCFCDFVSEHDLRKIYQFNSLNFSKIKLTRSIRKAMLFLLFGLNKNPISLKSKSLRIHKILNIESLWLIHNVFKYDIDLYLTFFNFIRNQISNFFYHQILITNSIFFKNLLDTILNETEDQRILKVLRRIALISLTWDFKSHLLTSRNKKSYLSLLERCITTESFQFPSTFAYISNSHDSPHNNKGVILGPLANSNMSLIISFSFRFESINLDEFILFNDVDDRFSIQIDKNYEVKLFEQTKLLHSSQLILEPKKWHRIVIYVYTNKLFIAIDGQILIETLTLQNSFLSNALFLNIAKGFDGLIGDIQILNSQNNQEDLLIDISQLSPLADEIPGSLLSLRPYIDDNQRCYFYDSKLNDMYFLYNGFLLHDTNNVFRLANEYQFVFSIMENIENSNLLEKAVYSILKFYSVDPNIELFEDDNSFKSFIFILEDYAKFINDNILNQLIELFHKLNSVSQKQCFLSRFLLNFDLFKAYHPNLYQKLVVNIIPNIILTNSQLIDSLSFTIFVQAIQKEESEMYQSFLFNDLFLFIHHYFDLHKKESNKPIDLRQRLFNENNELNRDILNKDLWDTEIDSTGKIIHEILSFVKFGEDQIVCQFILRFFGLIKTQIKIPDLLSLIDKKIQYFIFHRFLSLIQSTKISIDQNSYQDLIYHVTQSINQNTNDIDLFYSLFTLTMDVLPDFDKNVFMNLYQMTSDLNKQNNYSGVFLIWSILIVVNNIGNDDIINLAISSLFNFNDIGITSSFLILLFAINMNSNLLTAEQYKSIAERMFVYITSTLHDIIPHYDYANNSEFVDKLIIKFIYLLLIDFINQNIEYTKNDSIKEINWISLLELVQTDSLFVIFKSIDLNELLFLTIINQFDNFVQQIQELDEIRFNFGLIYLLLFGCKLDKCQNSSHYSNKLKGIVYKINSESPLSIVQDIIHSNGLLNDLPENFLKELFKGDMKSEEDQIYDVDIDECNVHHPENCIQYFSNNFIVDLLSPISKIAEFISNPKVEQNTSMDDNSVMKFLEIEQHRYSFRSYQSRFSTGNSSEGNFIVFSSNYVPLFYSKETEFSFLCEFNEKVYINLESEFILYEKVRITYQDTTKYCNLFYLLDESDWLYIGGMKIDSVNFTVRHSESIIELFLNSGSQLLIEFTSPIPDLIFDKFQELTENIINQKIDSKMVNLIEAIILVNFLRKRSFNMQDNQPLINGQPAKELINQEEIDFMKLKNWANEFLNFSFDNCQNLDGEIVPQNELELQTSSIGILSSPVFFTICNKRIFYIDADGRLTAATIVLPPRVPKATLQIFNRNSLLDQIKLNNNPKFRKSNVCTAFSVSPTNNIAFNQYLIAASFTYENLLIISRIEMSKLFTLKLMNLPEPVKYITSQGNDFVIISHNSNKVHLIRVSDKLDECTHRFFSSHCSSVSLVNVSKNFIISMSNDKLVCITHLDSLITLSSFSIDSIPKMIRTRIGSQSNILVLFDKEQYGQSRIVCVSLTGRVLWSLSNNDNSTITDFVPIRENSNEKLLAISKNNSEIQLIRYRTKDDSKKLVWESNVNVIHSPMNYDDGIQFLGFIGKEDSLNGIFLHNV